MYTLGIDIGSTTSKAVILRDGEEIIASSIVVATVGTDGVPQALEDVLKESGLHGFHRLRAADLRGCGLSGQRAHLPRPGRPPYMS